MNRIEQALRAGIGDSKIDKILQEQQDAAEIAARAAERWLRNHRKFRFESLLKEIRTRYGRPVIPVSIWETVEWGWHYDKVDGYMIDLHLTNKKSHSHWSFSFNTACDRFPNTLQYLKSTGRIQ